MERILLVEPNYKNKYPPIGLMKISSYFKGKGDFVEFHKGIMPKAKVEQFDKIFITTLFTFDFDMCVQTIKYYEAIKGSKNIFVGGIAATIMPEKFFDVVPNINLLKGQLTSSNSLGYNDGVNIDILPLDYDILWDIDYDYPAADSYFVYTSRGCPRKCKFCAVKTLEPVFYECENLKEQIHGVDERFGVKRQLLIMDNNILNSANFEKNVQLLIDLGFGKNNSCKKNSQMRFYIASLIERQKLGKNDCSLIKRILAEFNKINITRISNHDKEILSPFFDAIKDNNIEELKRLLIENLQTIDEFFERYHYHKIKRIVDFNQGLDARFFTDEVAEVMARLEVKPCRIAFDHVETKETYIKAIKTAIRHGIKDFSNYLLYNFEDAPADLWERLSININLCEEFSSEKINLFSFPMKYASIEDTHRNFVGKHWNKKYLRSINIILNVTSGIVAKEKDFFVRAFGNSPEEFVEILSMPADYIRYRKFFDDVGLTEVWRIQYRALDKEQKTELLTILSDITSDSTAVDIQHSVDLDEILKLYSITKKKFEENSMYYRRLYKI